MSGDPCCNAPSNADDGRRSVSRRMAIMGGLALGAVPLLPRLAGAETLDEGARERPDRGPNQPPIAKADFGFDPPRPAGEVHLKPIMFPVLNDPAIGQCTWSDTYLAPRGGGTRRHEGQDLMAPKMLKLLACVSGTIVELRHRPTGNSLYLRGDDGYYYCYLHMNNDRPGTDDGSNLLEYAFAPGITEGMRVEQGDHLSFVGDSGNAEYSGSHCHFEMRVPHANWWKAAAVNARYSLEAALPAQLNGPTVPPVNPVAPFDGSLAFVVRQANDFLGGVPGWDWLLPAVASIDDGKDADTFIAEQVDNAAVVQVVNPIIRMQLASFGATPNRTRVADLAALVRGGASLDEAGNRTVTAANLTASSLTNAEFIVHLDQTMWGRIGSGNRAVTLRRRLDRGLSRGALLHEVVQGRNYRIRTAAQVRTSTVWMSMLGRTMPTVHLDKWSARDKTDRVALGQLAGELRGSTEYGNRIS